MPPIVIDDSSGASHEIEKELSEQVHLKKPQHTTAVKSSLSKAPLIELPSSLKHASVKAKDLVSATPKGAFLRKKTSTTSNES